MLGFFVVFLSSQGWVFSVLPGTTTTSTAEITRVDWVRVFSLRREIILCLMDITLHPSAALCCWDPARFLMTQYFLITPRFNSRNFQLFSFSHRRWRMRSVICLESGIVSGWAVWCRAPIIWRSPIVDLWISVPSASASCRCLLASI